MKGKSLTAGVTLILLIVALAGSSEAQRPDPNSEESRIREGFRIAPVPLRVRGNNRDLVGLGSYIVNAQAGCNDCHTNPPFAEGGNPHEGEPEQINTDGYLAGGTTFGPFISPNITPDENGRPAGLTFGQFLRVMRTGHDPDDGHILQVMPWPVYGKMTRRDLRAVYEYLSAIPSIDSEE
ncbi:MAG TPA: cytochrome C [Thermoanaerobaculia bacterium]|nr:cytochrome C [Thermoanaerobaculia bacterium]